MFNLFKYVLNLIKEGNNTANNLYYLWKRNNWMLDIRSYTNYFLRVKIDRPIFLLGNQGDGLTLLSRMLRRNSQVVNVTGNSKYWAGADEMMNVYEPILTPEISGITIGAPFHPKLPTPRGWSYACNDLFHFYRKSEKDYNKFNEKKLKIAIGMAITHYGKKIKNPRFIDKSQIFSVKMSFINKLLERNNPFFIFLSRNPYVTIYRAAIGKAADMARASQFLNFKERLKICIEHWYNSIISIEKDKKKVSNFLNISFEDLVANPEKILKKVCNFIEIKYIRDMIPQVYHKIPFGVRFKDRWYPLRKNINKEYLKNISEGIINEIYKTCGNIASNYGYSSPF